MAQTSRSYDPEREAHKAWLGLLQPVGLVVSPPALVKAQAVLDKHVAPIQQALLDVVERPPGVFTDPDPVLADFPRFAVEVLGWSVEDLAGAPGGPPLPERLAVPLPDYGETLRPTYAVIDGMAPAEEEARVLLLVQVEGRGTDLDAAPRDGERGRHRDGWRASPQARLERLLRDTEVAAGLLTNGHELRLVYSPRGESSGHMGFPVAEMCTVGGRPILAALHMLLSEHRVFGAPDGQRLLDLLAESRKYQSEVSNRLAEQVLGALWELLRGFQAADEASGGRVLYGLARTAPDQIYGGLLTVIMRLVFLLYAEDQGLMPDDPVYARNYAIGGLYERLREDAGRYPDTMDQRFGAWAWLLSTFRLVFDGGGHGGLKLPTRHGQLFNPDEYPFLEGRPPGIPRVMGETFEAPRVSDGVLWRVLEGLLVLDGERLSYRALDVEQVGSVYESMMGFDVQTTPGRAIAVRPKHVVVDLDALLAQPGGKRAAWLKAEAECELPGSAADDLKSAATVDDLVAALGRRLSPQTPRPLPPGALFLQPGEERRRSGSHYTPRELTEPIVRTTLRPVLEALGERPTPEQILDLKVCDPAMGSGAFLVEACRQLAEALVRAWEVHDRLPALPPDEDPLLHARRLIAQRCLYGVDKNPFAVNLAKLSLWLVTLAKDHAFTFIDHALKHGDSLVGLTRRQIGLFTWVPQASGLGDLEPVVAESVDAAAGWRSEIQALDEGDYDQRRAAWQEAEDALDAARLIGDVCVAAFFGAEKDKDREALRRAYREKVDAWKRGEGDVGELLGLVEELREGERPVPPLHWEIEFPEVFGRDRGGFDAMVGNPPFLGGKRISTTFGDQYRDWLLSCWDHSNANGDLVAFFYRSGFDRLRDGGTTGLVATNSIGQADTRFTALEPICLSGGTIYSARRRVRWPGAAAVIVSVVHIQRGQSPQTTMELDGRAVDFISAYLFHTGGHTEPSALLANDGFSFVGSIVLGMGFTFDDSNPDATGIAEMDALLRYKPGLRRFVKPYIGGQEVNGSPTHSPNRYAIDLTGMPLDQAQVCAPELIEILREKAKPARDRLKRKAYREKWWLFAEPQDALYRACSDLAQVATISRVNPYSSFAWVPANYVFSESLVVFPVGGVGAFAILQSRSHELWARFFSSSMKDDLRYSPTKCFRNFPPPYPWDEVHDQVLTAAAQSYIEHRSNLMVKTNDGLTRTYNRFHDPDERSPDILRLRELHAAMDRAVLDAYGWTDISTDCEFLLDYEIDEETWGNKKKPWRYRWPDEVHDEVLARLLDLNQKRYEEEVAAGLHDKGAKKTKGKAKKPRAKAAPKSKAGPEADEAPKPAPLPLLDLMATGEREP